MRATSKTKQDMKRLYAEIHRCLLELQEIAPELTQIKIPDSNGLTMKAETELFIDRGNRYLKRVSQTLKILK